MPEITPCRSCKAPIMWVHHSRTGSIMPLDAEPVPDGNITLVDGLAHVHNGELFEEMMPEGPRYRSHFVTCPDAATYRKRKDK